ncbi:hypothetical protein C1H76_9581 [Elsinoe australis]|uniref:Uracil catabolism protein 4 n=1 Tax=Elsinoe australis TaxID=40998 RepID=A0A2P7YKS3_9PEZI|nr:Uracil catabolism protein 4 [Elsinoe australis]TKX18313.1 hypothetical protein C1H76_9581 [Elsinoe australis]
MGLFKNKSRNDSSITDNSDKNSVHGSISKAASIYVKTVNSSPSANASLPNIPLPGAPDYSINPAGFLRSIHAVRSRSREVMHLAKKNQLKHFTVDMAKFEETAQYVVSIIKRDYAPDYASIPPHGRWQHFEVGGRPRVDQLMATWPSSVTTQERCRRLIDLFLVSVLLDAGAGPTWQYKSKESGRFYRRSEGLAVASLEMFKAGMFSSNPDNQCQVDAEGLKKLNVAAMSKALQVTEANPMNGLEGRTNLLLRLADALRGNPEMFTDDARPGCMLNYLLSHPSTQASSVPLIPVPTLWNVLMDGLGPIWPNTRTKLDGQSLGDAWPCESLPDTGNPADRIIPFHKLTQWLCYSLMTPMTKLLHVHFAGVELLTGLPEYRNGGLLVDTGLLTLKPDDAVRGLQQYQYNAMKEGQPNVEVVPLFSADDPVIVEWRALTVCFLDDLLIEVNNQLGLRGNHQLSLAQMLEAGTWKGGRELAEVSRPNTKEPPIMILSDGTVF